MKLILDIADNKASAFMEMLSSYAYVKSEQLSIADAEILEEIREINKAYKNAELVKSGKLKTRPVEDLLNEL